MVNSGFNLEVQQWDSLSLQRSEMFIAKAQTEVLRAGGAKPVSGTAEPATAIALLWSDEKNKESLGYKYLAPLGRSDKYVLLHFKLEFTNSK